MVACTVSSKGHRRRWMSRGVVLCLLAVSANATLNTAERLSDQLASGADDTPARYAGLRGMVAPTQRVGFITGATPRSPEGATRHMTARYALAPILLARNDGLPEIVADFDTDAELEAYAARVDGVILAHPARGLALIKRHIPVP